MLLALALASSDPIPPAPPVPDGDRWNWVRTLHTITDTQTCEPNGTFAVSLSWRLHHGVEKIVIKRHDKMLPSSEIDKVAAALRKSTDLGYVLLSCENTRDAFVSVTYVADQDGQAAQMILRFVIQPGKILLFPPSEEIWSR